MTFVRQIQGQTGQSGPAVFPLSHDVATPVLGVRILLFRERDPQYGSEMPMQHRHLNHQEYTLAAIDDVIARGKRQDWAELRHAALAEPAVMEKIVRVCRSHTHDPYAQRYGFWRRYAEQHLDAA